MTRCKSLSIATAPVAAILLAGCAASSDRYPSLAIRDIERVSGTFEVEDGPVAEPPIPYLSPEDDLMEVPNLVSRAQSLHRRFLDAAPSARRTVDAAVGAGVTDNRWASAQVALADLESLRSQASVPLADLDRMHAVAAITFIDGTEIAKARAAVEELVIEEDRILAELRGRIAQ